MKSKLTLLALILLLGACGPGFRNREQSSDSLSFGPKFVDTNLSASLNTNATRTLQWEGTNSSATYYEVLNRLSEIDRKTPSVKIQQTIRTAIDAEITLAQTREIDITSGNYFRLLVSTQGAAAAQKLTNMKTELQAGLEKVISKIITWQFPQVSAEQPLSPLVVKIFADLENLVAWMKSENMNSSLIQALEDYSGLKTTILPQIQGIDSESNLQTLAQKILNLIASLKVTLTGTVAQELNSAVQLGQKINQMRNAEDALSALVFVWRMLPAADRYPTFSKSNKDLADLFKDSDKGDLDCFAGIKSCGLINYFKKEYFVLPGIQSKGVAVIRNDLNLQGVTRTRSKIVEMINSKTKDLASTAPAMIREKFGSATAILDMMVADFAGTMASRLQKQQLKESTLRSRELLGNESFSTRATVAGILPTLVRYSSKASTLKESLFLGSISEAAGEQLDPTLAALNPSADFSAKTLADALLNNARLLQGIRKDSAINSLQRVFGLSAQTLFTETQSSFLQNMKIFPKGALSALMLGRISRLLEVLKKENSPVFLVSTKDTVLWADKYKSGTPASPTDGAVIAGGIVDRQQGVRAKTVHSADVARMLSAISLFVESLEGIDSLVADYADAATLKAGRENARSLAVSFANYLSNHLRRDDGFIMHELDYAKGEEISNEVHLLDQALAIRAFMDARRALGVEIYQWEAVDTYFTLNAKLFDPGTGFYKFQLNATNQTQKLPEFLETLTGIMAVQSALPNTSQGQFQKIFGPWVTGVEQVTGI